MVGKENHNANPGKGLVSVHLHTLSIDYQLQIKMERFLSLPLFFYEFQKIVTTFKGFFFLFPDEREKKKLNLVSVHSARAHYVTILRGIVSISLPECILGREYHFKLGIK